MRLLLPYYLLLSSLLHFYVSTGLDCQLDPSSPGKVRNFITVHKSGKANFKRIQDAIDSVHSGNNAWVEILISPEQYTEKVTIPMDKPCIYLKGSGRRLTTIVWGDHQEMDTSATFTSYASNVLVKAITFKNTYNTAPSQLSAKIAPALAARIYGDKSAFYHCGFIGFQDTLWDVAGRHYFHGCYIEGAIDFIFGAGQSLYEHCEIYLTIGRHPEYPNGYITAQSRPSQKDTGGFVFKSCHFTGIGKAFLGRAWGPYSTVTIVNSRLEDVIVPQGWDAWNFVQHEDKLTYVEFQNSGPGADVSQRVPWEKEPRASFLHRFSTMRYIDSDHWMDDLPNVY